jgi:type IV secretion system protein TrbJ
MNISKKFILFIFLFFSMSFAINSFAAIYDVEDMAVLEQVTAEVGQLGDMLKQLSSISTQLDELAKHTELLNQELARLTNLDWDSASSKITELNGIVNQTDTLAYSASDIDTHFRELFPGYQSNSSTKYSDQYQEIVKNTQNTLNSILRSMNSSASNFSQEQGKLDQMQSAVADADGQTKAIQAASQISSEEVSQLQLLRQTVIAQTNAQTVYYAEQVQKQANSDAALNDALNNSYSKVDGKLDANPINDDFNF